MSRERELDETIDEVLADFDKFQGVDFIERGDIPASKVDFVEMTPDDEEYLTSKK